MEPYAIPAGSRKYIVHCTLNYATAVCCLVGLWLFLRLPSRVVLGLKFSFSSPASDAHPK